MEKKLNNGHLQKVIVPECDVVWMDKHEIWVNNSMFDVQSTKLENGVYTFTGLYDEEETRLVENERKASGMNREQNQLRAQLLKLLPVFFIEQAEATYVARLTTKFNYFILPSAVNPFHEIITPPPRHLPFC